MSRRTTRAAEAAAAEATEAARTLAQRSHEARAEKVELEPQSEKVEVRPAANPDRVEKLLGNRPHEQAYDELLAKREKAEPKAEEPEVNEPEKKAEEATPEAPKEAPAPEATQTSPETPAVPEAPKTVRVKVDGEEFDVSQADIDEAGGLSAYRIARANENRLRKTNETLAEVKRMLAEGFQKQTPAAPQQTDQQFIESKMDIVRFGTPAEAAAAWLEIQQRGQPKALDPNSIIDQATNKIRHDDAVKKFDQEFNDVVSNPILLKAIVAIRNESLAKLPKGSPVDWENFYRTIGNQVRTAVPRQSQPSTAVATSGTPSQASDKEARKASIVNLPTASARAESPKEEKELTPEEERKAWIADAKKARGQG